MQSPFIVRRKTLGLWLTVLALWVQLLLPAMLCPVATAQPAEAHNLCMAGSPAPTHHDNVPLHKGQCPACLSLHVLLGGFVPPQAPVVPVASLRAADRQPVSPAFFCPGYARALPPSRGPPASI